MREKKRDRRAAAARQWRYGRSIRRFLIVFVLILSVSGAVFLTNAKKESATASTPQEGQEAETAGTDVSREAETPCGEGEEDLPAPEESAAPPAPSEGSADLTPPPEEDSGPDGEDGTAVDLSYFDDAVFIGDSRTEGFFINTGLSNATFLTHQGLTVSEVFTKAVFTVDGKKTTVMDALSSMTFGKVYIMLGINETGWVYEDMFIEKYGEIIDGIREINPDAVIYIQSILPVSREVSETHSYLHNERIDTYNRLLQALAEEKGVCYLDVAQVVAAEDGSLPADAAADGIHLKKAPCEAWLTYLREHTAP